MKRFMLCAFVMIFGFCAVSYASGNEEKYVVVEVESEGKNRNEAIEQGWIAGIREAVGSFIDSKIELNNDQLTERIIAYNRGLVERYEVTGVDDSRANEGIYKIRMKLWILRDILRDGAEHIKSGGAEIPFSVNDLGKQKDKLDATKLEARNASQETSQSRGKNAAELLSAMLERYKPENFLTCYIPGKPEPVKDKADTFILNIEVSFNEKLYKESFVPDLEQVLDQISKAKKNTFMVRQKDALRNLAANKEIPGSDSVIFQADELGSYYTLAVYDKPERFGVRLYSFNSNNNVGDLLDKLIKRSRWVAGLILEIQDEDRETLETIKSPFSLKYLLSSSGSNRVFHPSIIKDGKECMRFIVPVEFEMPNEIMPYVKFLKASLYVRRTAGWFGADFGTAEAVIVSLNKHGAAYKAGLRHGDNITSINDTPISHAWDAEKILGSMYEDDTAKIRLSDGRTLSVTLGAKPTLKAGWLGVTLGNSISFAEYTGDGASIEKVTPDSPASKAGLRVTDAIQSINGKTVKNANDAAQILSAMHEGDIALIKMKYGGNVSVTLEAEASHGWLGGVFASDKYGYGVVLKGMIGDEPAHKAGLRYDDIITSINGIEVRTPEDAEKIINSLHEGDTVNIKLDYGRRVSVILGAKP